MKESIKLGTTSITLLPKLCLHSQVLGYCLFYPVIHSLIHPCFKTSIYLIPTMYEINVIGMKNQED